ncbi:MAG: outer membrane protein assembly factor BamA [Zetaproteobacteria bacterium]|nr:outer membrane protein assembly factor BamA [Zetaproteobacteria bacterium]
MALFVFRYSLLIAALVCGQSAFALDSGTITQVQVRGFHYVDEGAIVAKIHAKQGGLLQGDVVAADVKRLYATGLFSDVRVQREMDEHGLKIIYVVDENPMIADLDIVGNSEIKEKDLTPKLLLGPGKVFSEANLRIDTDRIRKSYLSKGFYQVNVRAETKALKDGRLSVKLYVTEGQVTSIKNIRFVGNQDFSDEVLMDVIASRESSFMTWFTDRDVFKRDRFEADTQMLQQYYLEHGYLDAKVESMQLALTPDKTGFYLTFSIFEGESYTVSAVDVQGDMVPSKEKLVEAIDLKKGEIYSLSALRRTLEAMDLLVGDEGYAFATVTPLFKRDIATRTVSVTFDIEKSREVFIDRVEIVGNEKTQDFVARRELRQSESERFSATKQKLSKDRLQRTNLFKDVRVSLPRAKADDRVNMKIDLEEEKTGSFSIGAGYSQLEKVFITTKVEERNFMGQGYTTNVSANIGAATQNYNLSATDPYFLDSDVGLTLNTFKTQTALNTVTFYNQNDIGGGFSLNIPIDEFLSYGVGYQFSRTNLSNISPTASLLIRSQEGVNTLGELSQSLIWDTRDRRVAATRGVESRLRLGVAGLGGRSRFVESSVYVASYHSIVEDVVFRPLIEYKDIQSYQGQSVPIFRRYSMGGIQSLRGFNSYGVSLRDPVTQEAVGGNSQIRTSMDLFFPLPFMQTDGFRGVLFTDAGMVWGNEPVLNVSQNFILSQMRVSAGFGIEWMSPIGPVAFVWGSALKQQPGDLLRTFEFSLGSGF